MEKINFTDFPSEDTPINAENLNRLQDNFENSTNINIITGGEAIKTGYRVDGKDVYVQRFSLGTLPNNATQDYPVNEDWTKIMLIRMDTTAIGQNYDYQFTLNETVCRCTLQPGKISVRTTSDLQVYSGYVNIYFIYR